MHSCEGLAAAAAPIHNSSATSASAGSYDGKIAGLYDLEETLGSGHFAVVKLARHVFTGAKVAVKVVDKTKLDEVSKAHLFQEVRCMKLVQHPNVVRLYEVIDTQTKLYLVLELGDGGDLYDYIMKHDSGLSEELARKYFRQILRAISYCHQLHVVHRDLKPENVVFFEKLGVVKLTDFGFSNKFSPGQKLETFCGSLAYSAPEILLGDSYDAPAVDIWSLGVILYMLVCGQPPFEKANDSETLTMIMDCKYTVPQQVTGPCRKLIASMLVRDPKKRASLEQIAVDAWLKDTAESGDLSDFLPLVSREQLSEEDHAFIVQKMINGNIASKENILQSLDKDKYNHITATYFLLAEIRLRKRREERNQKQNPQLTTPDIARTNYNEGGVGRCSQLPDTNKISPESSNKVVVPISINVCPPAAPLVCESKTDKRSRKCSIVREEDEDDSSYDNTDDANDLRVAVRRRESISDGRLNKSVQERSAAAHPKASLVVPGHPRSKIIVSVDATLAQKLNQIDSHPATKIRDDGTGKPILKAPPPMQDALKGLKELEIGKFKAVSSAGNKNPILTHRRTKLNKIRTPSCSSSEASDDDTKARSKKKINKFVGDTPTRFCMHRRDSHDDSSDSQDPTFPSSGSHGTNIIASNSNPSNVEEKNDGGRGHTQRKEQTKSASNSSTTHTNKAKQLKEQVEKHFQLSFLHRGNHQSLVTPSSTHAGRRRIRESQSLDRITEAQEYELRHRHLVAADTHSEQRNSLFNLNSFSVAETNEEYDNDDEEASSMPSVNDSELFKNALNVAEISLRLKHNKNSMYHLNSIEEIDLILEGGERGLTKAVQITRSKCFVTMKKIRRLGKYFPAVNFSS